MGMGNCPLCWECRWSLVWEAQCFVRGMRTPFRTTSIPQGSSPGHTSWPETEHHMKVSWRASAPSDGPARFRPAPAAVIRSGSLVPHRHGTCSSPSACITMWIIASFPVTTAPARGAGKLGNKRGYYFIPLGASSLVRSCVPTWFKP